MKYTISYILLFCLIFTLFTACGEAPESPTDVKETSSVVSVAQKQEGGSSVVYQPIGEQESQNNQEEKEDVNSFQPAESQVPLVSEPNSQEPETPQPPVQESDSPAQSTDAPVADINVEYPTFTGENSLKDWLLGKHPDYFQDGRGDMLNAIGTNKVIYYRPSIPSNHELFMLNQIEVHTPSGAMDYLYNGNDVLSAELGIGISNSNTAQFDSGFKDIYDDIKAVYENKSDIYPETVEGYCYQYNEVDFFYAYMPTKQNSWIVWTQFGLYHYAVLHGHFDQIEEIIPLLYLQQVKLDNNTVIK